MKIVLTTIQHLKGEELEEFAAIIQLAARGEYTVTITVAKETNEIEIIPFNK